MSFCRITGKSRGLPKPNYFPLLPPISPADAKRFCRITNKSQGLPGHHFIPALLGAKGLRAQCRVTAKSEGQAPHHFPALEGALKPHDIIPGYKYVFPKFDEDHKLQRRILSLISSKTVPSESNARYVYAVEERSTGLVIPAGLEAAVRDGEIRDLMLDKERDTMLVKLRQGPSVAIDITDLIMEEGMVLWDGMGPSQAVLKQREKEEQDVEIRKKKRQEGVSRRKQIFEDKERAAEEEETELAKIKEARKSKVVKVKMRGGAEHLDVMVDSGPTRLEDHFNDVNGQPVFGHIVQTATAVEFFPGDSILNLPEGKVVPGRLMRNADGVKFVPGIMSDDRFIPGQVVLTNSGEQFVPGQVVDTRDGPKFVPGQVAETISGPKFVPGQTIETEDGPQFVPGQIIETKAGPTFIPGQIIVTDDEPRFVPGRVVETAEGPRFVPGRVIESGNHVTFVSGQVVETSEGLRFIAPDLEYMPEGGHEFSVQGFEVSPEELKLLRPAGSCDPATSTVFTVDSRMLRQLSEAGMSVGRQVPTKLPDVDISALPVVVEKLKLNGAEALKMSRIITVLSQVALKISQRSDLCASEIPLDDDAGDKILCAVRKNKDLGKYLQAIVASSVVAARNNFNEKCLLAAVTSAMESALSAQYDNTLTKESILSVIGRVIDGYLPMEKIVKGSLLAEISAVMESEVKTQLESAVTEESVLAIFGSVLESKLGKENSTSVKAILLEAVKSAIKKEQAALCKVHLNKESFLAMVKSTVNSGILEKANDVLSREALLTAIRSEIEKSEASGRDWEFSEESILPIINSAIESEVLAKGLTLNNGSLPVAFMTSIKNELSQKQECLLTEEKLMACLTSVIEKELPFGSITKQSLIQAVTQSIAAEKSKKALSEEKLLATAFAALEKTVSAKRAEIPDAEKFLKIAEEKIREDVTVKHENAEIRKMALEKLEKAVEREILEIYNGLLNEEMALAAVNSVVENEIQQSKFALPKQKISLVIKSAFEKEKKSSSNGVMSKEKLLAVLQEAVEEEEFFGKVSILSAFNAAVEEKRREKYETPLTDEVIMSAVDTAVQAVISQGQEMKVSKASLLSTVTAELEKVRSSEHGNITEGRVIAAVHSAVKGELLAKGEKTSIEKTLLEALDSAMDNVNTTKCHNLLSENEVLSTLDAAIEMQLSRNLCSSLSKTSLMAKINSAITEKKAKKRESILTEEVLLECMQSAIEAEVAASGEATSVVESLLTSINAAIREEREAKRFAKLTEESVIQTLNSAIDSELIQNNKISLTRCELVQLVTTAIEESRTQEALSEESLIKIVQSTIEEKVATESEAHLLLKAFGSAIEKERLNIRKKPMPEQAFLDTIGNTLETKLPAESPLKKEKLLSAIVSSVNNEVSKHGELLTEAAILSVAYSAIEREAIEKGESPAVQQLLLFGIDSIIESKKDAKRVVREEILLEAINAIADEFEPNPERKEAVVSAVTSAMEKAKLTNGEPTLIHKKLLEAVSDAVVDHFSNSSETSINKETFITAVCSAIAKEQVSKRGMLMTKEMLSKALTSAVQNQLTNNPGLMSIKETLLEAVNSVVESECACVTEKRLTEKALLSAIGASIESALGDLSQTNSLEKVVDSMHKFLSENLDEVIVGTVNYMVANESPMDKLKFAMNNSGNTIQVIEKLSSVLNDNMGEAFQKLSARDPTLLENVIQLLDADKLSSKVDVTEALQKAIVGAVRQKSVETLRSLRESSDGKDFKELLLQSVGLAKALGMNQVASLLLDVVSDSKSHEVLASDETVIDILQRLTIMRQFAETKPELASALTQLISDPELAKRDPGIRELVRHSTALMTVPEEVLRSSADIPAALLASGDPLAMEQFLARARRPRTLVIIKAGMQMVVPKEAARAVLTGQVPYAVLDERSIRYFEPLHVFSTMKLPRYAAHCFSMYRCPEVDYESGPATPTCLTPRGSFSSAEDFTARVNGHWDRQASSRKPLPCKRVAELGKRPLWDGGRPCPMVYRSLSGSRLSDLTRRADYYIRDIYN